MFDVIVVGGGHAGCEAASAAARCGANVALVTHKISSIGQMSCNPSFGGIAKGTVVKEIDALGGLMAEVADCATIHSKTLNKSKGPAVWSPRVQADRVIYQSTMQDRILNHKNLTVIENAIEDLIIQNHRIKGVIITSGEKIYSSSVIITTGTFLASKIYVGDKVLFGGRMGDASSNGLSRTLKKCGFELDRLRTGTPARLKKNSINWKILEIQNGDENPEPLSYQTIKLQQTQIPCHITYTNERTHDIIRKHAHLSPAKYLDLAKPPRYCVSIDDKIIRFSKMNRHRIFLEPEGLNSGLIYPNGITTALPEEIQLAMTRSIHGLEHAEIDTYGYTIEYDYVNPVQLHHTLETKLISGLYLAGQINGTTGYEEAGGQGILAGINAAQRDKNLILERSSSYIGVMIDDLVTIGTGGEAYRLFTSRSEYRLSTRADNADLRLNDIADKFSLIPKERIVDVYKQKSKLQCLIQRLKSMNILPHELIKLGIKISDNGVRKSAFDLLSYYEITFDSLKKIWPSLNDYNCDEKIELQVSIAGKYHPYIQRQENDIRNMKLKKNINIPKYLNNLESLSNEVREKIKKYTPLNVSELRQIPGITPAAIITIINHIKRHENSN